MFLIIYASVLLFAFCVILLWSLDTISRRVVVYYFEQRMRFIQTMSRSEDNEEK